MALKIDDSVPSECTKVGNLPLQSLKQDDDGKLQILIPTPEKFLEKTHDSTLENLDPLSGMDEIFKDNRLTICNINNHPTPWGIKHTPFQLYVKDERKDIQIEIDWTDHRLVFGIRTRILPDPDVVNKPGSKSPNKDFPFFGTGMRFKDIRVGNISSLLPELESIILFNMFDDKFVRGVEDGLNEVIILEGANPNLGTVSPIPILSSKNNFITYQVGELLTSYHSLSTPFDSIIFNPVIYIDKRTITWNEAIAFMDDEETAEETETIIFEGFNPDFGTYNWEIDVVYRYSLPEDS